MRCDNKGQMGAVEGIIIFILMVALGGIIYLLFKKDSNPNIYESGSKPKIMEISPKPTFGGCVRVDIVDSWGKNERITNSQTNST